MSIPGAFVRAELRRGRGSLTAMAALVAVVVATVAIAVAGAHRTTTSVHRFRTWANASDGLFQVNDAGTVARLRPEIDAVEHRILATGETTAVGQRWLVNGFFEHEPIPDISIYSDPSGHFGTTIERPRVLRGRLPHRDAPDEIALNEQAASLLHREPGARLTTKTWTSDDLAKLFGGGGFPGFNGPKLRLRVVGVVRTLDGLSGNVERGSPYGFAGAGLLAAHPALGAWPPALFVRTRDGAAGIRSISRAIAHDSAFRETVGTGTTAGEQYLDGVQQGADGSATGLVVFAGVAALAGALVVGQAAQRHLAARATEGRQLVELGLTRRATAATLVIPVVVATALGALVGVAGAVVGSQWLPIGVAGRAEVDPGIRVHVPVLVLCLVVAVLAVAAFGFFWARSRVARVGPAPAPSRRVSIAVRAALGLGARPAVATGVQLATERSTEAGPVPIRTAFAGVVLAVTAIVAAGVVARSNDLLVAQPDRWGRTWHSEPDVFGGTTVDDAAPRIAADRRIAEAARFASGGLRIHGHDLSGYSLSPVRGHITFTRLRGRLPTRRDEVALGESTLARAHASIGSRIRVLGESGAHSDLLVSGTVVLPPTSGEEHTLNNGAVMRRSTLRRLVGADDFTEDIVLRYPAHANVARVERALARDYGADFNAFTEPQVPGSVRRLSDTRAIAVALAWFFGALGLLSLVHALWVGTWRRRIHLTMLRVLGMRRAQVLGAVILQAVLLVTAAIVVGVPLGLVVGRTAWHLASDDTGAVTDAAAPWTVIAVLVPIALAASVLVAWWPGWRAGRREPAVTLRTE